MQKISQGHKIVDALLQGIFRGKIQLMKPQRIIAILHGL